MDDDLEPLVVTTDDGSSNDSSAEPEPGTTVQTESRGRPAGTDTSGRRVLLVLEAVKVALLLVVAAAMVVIAVAQTRQARVELRMDCRERASNFREDLGSFPLEYNRRVEQACGGSDPVKRP